MTGKTVLILGGRSDIGLATAHRFASSDFAIQLAARNADSLSDDKSDIELRYAVPVTLHDFDALDTATHGAFVDALPALPDVAVCAVGLLGNQADDERDPTAALTVLRTNFEGCASILEALAARFERRGSGTLVGISSVAGDRGRASNYIYGSAKAGFTAYLSGLRNRLHPAGVHVVTVLPGFVRTRMTEGLDLPSALTAAPEEVARAIIAAVNRRRDTVYVRRVWRPVMLIIRSMPEFIFKRLKI